LTLKINNFDTFLLVDAYKNVYFTERKTRQKHFHELRQISAIAVT